MFVHQQAHYKHKAFFLDNDDLLSAVRASRRVSGGEHFIYDLVGRPRRGLHILRPFV